MGLHRLLVGLLVAIIGCGPSTKEIMNSWKGDHVSKLIRSWGPPKQVVSDGAGGKIYIWSDRIYIPIAEGKTETRATVDRGPYTSRVKSTTTYTPPIVVDGDKVRMFWVNSNGIIHHWQAKGFINDPETDAVLIGVIVISLGVVLILAYLEGSSYY